MRVWTRSGHPELKFSSLQMGLVMPVLPGWWGTLLFIPEPPSRCLLTAHQILALLYILGKTVNNVSAQLEIQLLGKSD